MCEMMDGLFRSVERFSLLAMRLEMKTEKKLRHRNAGQ